MTIQTAKAFLLRCIGINFLLLLVWSLASFAAHDVVYGISAYFFRVSAGQFDAINFAGIVAYKMSVLFFNVIPYIALVLVARSRAADHYS